MAFTKKWAVLLLTLLTFTLTCVANGQAQSDVHVIRANRGFELERNGHVYPIHGVGGKDNLELLAKSGGNSIRTWSTEGLEDLLDDAHQHGLSVTVGMWLGHERHGFNYQDEKAVVQQLEMCLETVRTYKDHPAVLMWGIGNEMEGSGNNPAIWYAVNHIAREIKRIDPNHPTMTVIAELGENENKLHAIQRFCPDVDIVGVNSYGGIFTLAERYARSGIDKPYVVTEHGPLGPWETGKTPWGSPLEATSTEKAQQYAKGFELTVKSEAKNCLGTYAFLWGQKQETTATWFGMLLPDGSKLGAVDAMTTVWTGAASANQCPQIESLKLDHSGELKPGYKIEIKLVASDPDNDKLEIQWVLRQDSGTVGVGGDYQAEERAFSNAITAKGATATIAVPDGGGGYRLFAYVRDGNGNAAVANIPFHVDAAIKPVASIKAKLPFAVYSEKLTEPPFAPSGYMGNTSAITMKLDSTEEPRTGKTCLKVEYAASDNWGGVLWQSPANDWDGSQPGGFNLTGATALEFFVRGREGGERVSFMLGVIEGNKPYRDSSRAELKEVQLTDQWQKMRIPLNGLDLSRIKTGFGWSLAANGKPVTFYLDDIQYVAD